MPTYQYTCTECAESLERVQSFSDPALTECPACEGKLRKVFNSVGIVFKGSGFYRTDSRAGAVGAESAKSDGKSESKSDAAAAAATKSDSGKSDSGTSDSGKSADKSSSNGASSNSSASSGSAGSSSSSSSGAKAGASASKG